MQRRDFLKLLLSTPIAAELDVEKLLWVPKPIITVPTLPLAYGSIERATYVFWRNQMGNPIPHDRIVAAAMQRVMDLAALKLP